MKKCTDPCALSAILIAAQSRHDGQRDAQGQLYAVLKGDMKPVMRKAFRIVPEADREDALHDAFVMLITTNKPYDPKHPSANPIAYCFNIARTAANWRGREREKARVSEVEVEDLKTATEDVVEHRSTLHAIHALNPLMFRVVAAVANDGDTAKIAGARIGMTPSKVCRSLQAYAEQCREWLQAA